MHYIPRHDAITLAANDAYADNKSQADHVCSGADDDADINTAIDDLTAIGGAIKLSMGHFGLSSSLVPKNGITISGVFPGATSLHADSWGLGYTVDTGTVITYPGGIVFQQDMSGGNGTLSALTGVVIEKLGFDNVLSILVSGDTNKNGFTGSVIRDILASNVTGLAFDMTNMSLSQMMNIKVANAYQLLRLSSDSDLTVCTDQPGNCRFDDLYAYITAAGSAVPSIHLRAIDRNGVGLPLNFCHFTRIQTNRMLGGSTSNHILLEGTADHALINGMIFDGLDLEGAAEYHIKGNWVVKTNLIL